MNFKTLIPVLVALLALTSCSSGGDLAITNVDAQSFLSKIEDKTVTVVDVRTAQEYQEGHLANALNINVESPDFASAIANLDKTKEYALYCRSGRRSTVAANEMAKAGFTLITNYNKGGFTDLANLGVATSK
ncbi:MAG: rhodanese-like domain-containing protein [Actinomycetota bacterium]|nr:rhodanese-like domain-containing protein [Actinomycetota bacterium]